MEFKTFGPGGRGKLQGMAGPGRPGPGLRPGRVRLLRALPRGAGPPGGLVRPGPGGAAALPRARRPCWIRRRVLPGARHRPGGVLPLRPARGRPGRAAGLPQAQPLPVGPGLPPDPQGPAEAAAGPGPGALAGAAGPGLRGHRPAAGAPAGGAGRAGLAGQAHPAHRAARAAPGASWGCCCWTWPCRRTGPSPRTTAAPAPAAWRPAPPGRSPRSGWIPTSASPPTRWRPRRSRRRPVRRGPGRDRVGGGLRSAARRSAPGTGRRSGAIRPSGAGPAPCTPSPRSRARMGVARWQSLTRGTALRRVRHRHWLATLDRILGVFRPGSGHHRSFVRKRRVFSYTVASMG